MINLESSLIVLVDNPGGLQLTKASNWDFFPSRPQYDVRHGPGIVDDALLMI